MLTSSDAKWRCMWHMLVWSILLTLVSQFLDMLDHVAFYIFASLCMLVLPIVTAVYSNTEGRKGAGLIRTAYVFCDPVLACITLTPVLLLNHLPIVVNKYSCLRRYPESWNDTCDCLKNRTGEDFHDAIFTYGPEKSEQVLSELLYDVSMRFTVIQLSVATPILLSLLMGRRTTKMSTNTYVFTFAYWFVTSIESVDMIETIRLGDIYKTVIYTTEAIISITMIFTNSYSVVTLCSYISPPAAGENNKVSVQRFDFIYHIFVGSSAILFAEVPLLVARFQILAADSEHILPALFYLWFIKDFIFIFLIIFMVFLRRIFNRIIFRIPCKMQFDNPDIVFQPEKRDVYIERKKTVTFQDPPAIVFGEECEKPISARKKPSFVSKQDVERPSEDNNNDSKVPTSVLKNRTIHPSPALLIKSSRLSQSSIGQLTDLSGAKLGMIRNGESSESNGSSPSVNRLCVATKNPSNSSTPSSSSGQGARPKLINIDGHNVKKIKKVNEIKSRPTPSRIEDTSSDTESDL